MREIEDCCVGEMESFVSELTQIMSHNRIPVYRGQSDVDWKLLPGLLREDLMQTEFSDWTGLDAMQMMKFKQRSSGMLPCQPHSELEWKAQATHRGLLTSFSSWTECGLIALYFATEKTPDEKDGVVWRLMPGDSSMDLSQDHEGDPGRPSIYRPRFLDRSMENQRICFMSHPIPEGGSGPQAFEDYYSNSTMERMSLCRIRIPHYEKDELRKKLALLAVDARTIYPGLQGVCGQIREEIHSFTDSCDWVFDAA